MRRVSASNFPPRADSLGQNGYTLYDINPNIYRWNAITSVNISGTIYQACCFWNSDGNLVVGHRQLDSSWTFFTSSLVVSGDDNHDTVVIGLDPNGYVHVAYDMHNQALKYRRSTTSINSGISSLGVSTLSMLGTNEGSVTYPTFLNDPAGNLYFMFRDGVSGNGDLFMYKYDHNTTTWAAVSGTTAGKVISGKPVPASPYFDHPDFDVNFGSGGFFHLSWHWRDAADSDGAYHDKCYVKWDGTNWYQANGTGQTIPITQSNCEIVDSTATTDIAMSAFACVVSDGNGNPHIIYPKSGNDGFKHLFQAYYNGSAWIISQITQTAIPIVSDVTTPRSMRPASAVNRNTNVLYVFYIDDVAGGMWVAKTSDFSSWTFKSVYPYDSGEWKPKYDFVEFARSGKLYFIIETHYGGSGAGVTNHPLYALKTNPSVF